MFCLGFFSAGSAPASSPRFRILSALSWSWIVVSCCFHEVKACSYEVEQSQEQPVSLSWWGYSSWNAFLLGWKISFVSSLLRIPAIYFNHGGAWWAAVHGVAKSQRRLSDFTFFVLFFLLPEETYSKKYTSKTNVREHTACVFFWKFYSSYLTFKSLLHFECISVCGMRK